MATRPMRPEAAATAGERGPGLGLVAGWRERWRVWRDRTVADPAFQRRAAGWPIFRRFAQRHARELFDVVAGFVYSQVLVACVRLRLFEILAEGPIGLHDLSARTAVPGEALERLLEAAQALRLVERRDGGRWGLATRGAALLANPGVAAMIEHHAVLYADLADPVTLLRAQGRGSALSRYWAYARSDTREALTPQRAAEYSALMAASQQLIADDVLDAYPMQWHRTLLDVGGGTGAFLRAAAARAPSLRLQLFDLPDVAQLARVQLADAGLGERSEVFGGDFTLDALPTGADVISLVRVLFDHDDATVLRLLRAAHAALPRNGVLLVAEPMAGMPGAEPMGAAYFGMYLLAMGHGRARTPQRIAALAREAGFTRCEPLPARRPLLVAAMACTR